MPDRIELSPAFARLAGESATLLAALARADSVAATSWPVLVVGETGSGKSAVAGAIHAASGRAGDLVAVNCAALPLALLESELFGHTAGAFTGATDTRDGLFHQANGGTLFLDEIGDMSLDAQASLLRVVETGQVRRVGGQTEDRVDVRIVAATHRDLRAAIADGTFREDLYYRIGAFMLELPPLRDRKADIGALASHFLRAAAPGKRLAADARRHLNRHAWPGNLRELQSVMRQAVVAAGDAVDVTAAHLPVLDGGMPAAAVGSGLGEQLRFALAARGDAVREAWAQFLVAWFVRFGSRRITRPEIIPVMREVRGSAATDHQLRNEWNRDLRHRLIATGLVDHHRRALLIDVAACERVARPAGAPRPMADSASAPAAPGALPEPDDDALSATPTALIGRDSSLDAIVHLFEDGSPLVTITGPGGVGKTSIAVAVGQHLRGKFGTCRFVDLTAGATRTDVRNAVAAALRIPIDPTSADDQLDRALAGMQRALLILDNFEQLIPVAADTVGRWRAVAPGIQWLVTSRTALGLGGEQQMVLDPLSAPLADAPDVAALAGLQAVELFVDRARRAVGEFELDATNARDVAAICHATGGLPLAIEMAAARLRVMSPGQLAARLGEVVDLLHSTRRDSPPHQRAMRATLDWSHGLLDPAVGQAFAALCYFRAGFTLEAAEAVVDPLIDLPTIDALQALIDHSFVRAPDAATGRYRIIPVIREYGADHLSAMDDATRTALAARHSAWFALRANACMGSHDTLAVTRAPGRTAATLVPERANLTVALETAIAAADTNTAVPLAIGLALALDAGGELHRARAWFEQVLALRLDPVDRLTVAVHWAGAALGFDISDPGVPTAIDELLDDTGKLIDDTPRGQRAAVGIARLRLLRARLALQGHLAIDIGAELEAAGQACPADAGDVLDAEFALAQARWKLRTGHPDAALDLVVRGELAARRSEASRLVRQALVMRFDLLTGTGRHSEALALARTSAVDLSDPMIGMSHWLTVARLELESGDAAVSVHLARRGAAIAARVGLLPAEAAASLVEARAHLRLNDTDAASRCLRTHDAIDPHLGHPDRHSSADAVRAGVALAQGDLLTAIAAADRALAGNLPPTLRLTAQAILAQAHHARGDQPAARRIIESANRNRPPIPATGAGEAVGAVRRLEGIQRALDATQPGAQ